MFRKYKILALGLVLGCSQLNSFDRDAFLKGEIDKLFLTRNANGLMLVGANLDGLNISRFKMMGAYLRNASMKNVDATGTDLRYANMVGVDVEGAILADTKFYGANMEGVRNIHKAVFKKCTRWGYIRGEYPKSTFATDERLLKKLSRGYEICE